MEVNKELKAPLRQKAFNKIQQRLSITPESPDETFSLLLNNKRSLSRGEVGVGGVRGESLGIFQLINYTNNFFL